MYEVFKECGICPQFDCLWENLNVREHLYIFGSMKGLHGDILRENIDFYIEAMQLEDHVHKKFTTLSGGNKRKLCVTNSLIGSPSLQFLDEPSTGMDPVARRYLYETMINNLNNREASIVLTTHSLAEAESLCTKIGILINGKFVCIGSNEYLKQRYGLGYKITIPRKAIRKGDVFAGELQARFPGLEPISDNSQEFVSFKVPMQGFLFSTAFKHLIDMKQLGIIDDYSLTNTSLEQIFLAFSRYQVQTDNQLRL